MHRHYLTQVIPIPPSIYVYAHARTHILAHPFILQHFESDAWSFLHPNRKCIYFAVAHYSQQVGNYIKWKLFSSTHQQFLDRRSTYAEKAFQCETVLRKVFAVFTVLLITIGTTALCPFFIFYFFHFSRKHFTLR